MTEVYLESYDEVYLKVDCDDGIAREISERFTFEVPGARWSPKFKSGMWDGRIRLFNPRQKLLYKGLGLELVKFCKDFDYDVGADKSHAHEPLSASEASEFITRLNIPPTLIPHDFQQSTFIKAVREKRGIYLSATSSGKSLMIYMIASYFKEAGLRTLIIVPSIALAHQFEGDFVDYGGNPKEFHKIFSGQEKNTGHPFTVTTWQSAVKMGKEWINGFDVICGDEAHTFTAKSLISIMEKATKVKYRYGFSGTLHDSTTNELVLTGLFGPITKVISARELIDRGLATELKPIKVLVLEYDPTERTEVLKKSYEDELRWIMAHPKRNMFIKNLVLSLNGNVVLSFQRVEKHGKLLYELIKESTDRPVYYVHGGVGGKERNELRPIIEQHDNAIIVASVGTFSTGINIKRLNYLIFGSPSKAKIKILQYIGRLLRKSVFKSSVTVFDIADNLCKGTRKNYTFKHLLERLKVYDAEEFTYKIYNIALGNQK